MQNKRGQFFLAAAVIIVGIVIGLASVINTVRVSGEQDAFYDKASEISFETNKVLDYGIFDGGLGANLDSLLEDHLNDYADYAREQIIFLYGDGTDMDALYFNTTSTGSIGITTGSVGAVPVNIEIQEITGTEADVVVIGNTVTVEIEGVVYDFDLRGGKNFFFVMIKTIGEERHVAQKH